jgi:hypothetical protein
MSTEKSGDDLPLSGLSRDGWSTEDEATLTCACGAVQMVAVSHRYIGQIFSLSRYSVYRHR